jgi:ATP diphosphatase
VLQHFPVKLINAIMRQQGDFMTASESHHKTAADDEAKATGLLELIAIMRQLRNPQGGCPWDIEQDFASVAPYTIEEAYEVADVIERRDWPELPGELGDLLLQVVFHAQMADELDWFDFADVCAAINAKLVRRHPHVFPPDDQAAPAFDAEQQTRNWEQLKQQEREARGQTSILDNVPGNLPELSRALKLQKRAARVGFDWPDAEAVMSKLDEELDELEEARGTGRADRITDELGDVLFVLVNLARKLDVDAAAALRHANAKFERRFRGIEHIAEQQDTALSSLNLDAMEALWQQYKLDEQATQDNHKQASEQ